MITTVFSFFRNITWVSKCVTNSVTVLQKLSYILLKLRDEHTDGKRETRNLHYRMNCGQKTLDSITFSLENLISFFEKFKVLAFVFPFSPFFLLPQTYHKPCHKSTGLWAAISNLNTKASLCHIYRTCLSLVPIIQSWK